MTVILTGLVALFALLGCQHSSVLIGTECHHEDRSEKNGPPPWAPAHGYRAKHHYYYYPSSYVYFDIDREVYFFLESDEWKLAVTLPGYIKVDIDEQVTLYMDSEKPYEYHMDVVKNYPPGQQKNKTKEKVKKNKNT